MSSRTFLLLACLALPAAAHADVGAEFEVSVPTSIPRSMERAAERPEAQPWPVRLLVAPVRRGMFIRLPIMDTDPNRGITYGFMPIWVFKERDSDRIEHILAPSVSYNATFKAIPTFRYYLYPTSDSDLQVRASVSEVTDRELLAWYSDRDFLDRDVIVGLRLQYNIDGSKRFFGVGPGSVPSAESNYTEDVIQYHATLGGRLPWAKEWIGTLTHRFEGLKISDGPINAIPDINTAYPGRAPFHRHQLSAWRGLVEYDTRDHAITTTRGTYVGLAGETSERAWGSEYGYQLWLVDVRRFHRWGERDTTGTNLLFKQLVGDAPFWHLPQLGGKYVHRAYGEGRFIDEGMVTLQGEHRHTFWSTKMTGVTVEFEAAPFAGVGTVFPTPGSAQSKYLRPVVGGAIRAVARPQVVGSIDFGVGQEGLTAFMDINYSF